MLAQRGDANVFYDNHLVMLVTRKRNHVLLRIFPHTRSQLSIHLRNSLRCFLETGAFRILANPFDDQTHSLRDQVEIDVLLLSSRPLLLFGYLHHHNSCVRYALACRIQTKLPPQMNTDATDQKVDIRTAIRVASSTSFSGTPALCAAARHCSNSGISFTTRPFSWATLTSIGPYGVSTVTIFRSNARLPTS